MFILLSFLLNISYSTDKVELLRSLNCAGSVQSNTTETLTVRGKLTDSKITFEEDGFEEFYSSLILTSPKNKKEKLYGKIVSYDSMQDPIIARNTPRNNEWDGLTFFDFSTKKNPSPTSKRDGLLILSFKSTEGKQSSYDLIVQFGEQNDPNVEGFAGSLVCE